MIRYFTVFFSILTVSLTQATTLDWDSVNWSKGSTQQTFYNIDGSDIDVTITLTLSYDTATYNHPTKDKSYSTTSSYINGGPDDNTTFGGDGYSQNEESLYMGINLATDDRSVSYLDVTIEFSESVSDLSFSLFDVDTYGYNYKGGYEKGIQFVDVIDELSSSNNGIAGAGPNVGFNNEKIYSSNDNGNISYTGNTIQNDDGTDQSDNSKSVLAMSWEDSVDKVSFRYGSGFAAVRDPGQQAISLSDISFYEYNAVPEPSTYLIGTLSSLFVIGSIIRKRRQKKQQEI